MTAATISEKLIGGSDMVTPVIVGAYGSVIKMRPAHTLMKGERGR